jgi:hypothetical protein
MRANEDLGILGLPKGLERDEDDLCFRDLWSVSLVRVVTYAFPPPNFIIPLSEVADPPPPTSGMCSETGESYAESSARILPLLSLR